MHLAPLLQRTSFVLLSLGSFALAQQPAPAAATTENQITEDGVITGTMDIDFTTRTNLDTTGDLKKGSPALGAKDSYKLDITVAKLTEFVGTITRQPNLYSKIISKKKQEAQLNYSIDLVLFNPRDLKQKRTVGKWVGTLPVDTESGAYDLSGGKAKDSALRVAIDTVGKATGFQESFDGKLIGKAEKKEGLASYTYKRLVGDRTVQVVVKKSDPMRFENLTVAKGPSENYPRTIVRGRLDYDYETGNYYTDGIKFNYTLDGKEYEDTITGSIKWVEDKDRATNGKGYYDFNLRFNEGKNKKAPGEGAAFEKMSEEDAFFAVDNSIPSLTGRINYVDTMGGADGKTPVSSKVTYALNANKLTKQQIMNFFKLWLVAVGPTNDE
jgi:hypothetical protein